MRGWIFAACGVMSGFVVACHAQQTRPNAAPSEASAPPTAASPAPAQSAAVPPAPLPPSVGRLLSSVGVAPQLEWTPEEQQKDIAIRELTRSASASVHLVRARGAEKPHTHDAHDLVVVLLTGTGARAPR